MRNKPKADTDILFLRTFNQGSVANVNNDSYTTSLVEVFMRCSEFKPPSRNESFRVIKATINRNPRTRIKLSPQKFLLAMSLVLIDTSRHWCKLVKDISGETKILGDKEW